MSGQAVAENATTANRPEIPDSPTCNDSLQVGQLAVGMVTQGQRGSVVITAIRDGKWQFSDNPQRALWFREIETGEKTTGLYHPDAPLKNNWQIHQDAYLATTPEPLP